MKIKNIKKTLFIFLVASFLVLVIVPGTMAIFSEKKNAKINLNIESLVFTVTFDSNGGTSTGNSRELAYGSTYGELPEAEKCGSTFLGWYTGLTDGIKIEEDSIFNVANDQTLYARFLNHNILHDVFTCEQEREDVEEENKLVAIFDGEHQDSMDVTKSTENIYHFYASNDDNGNLIQEKNNVIFADHCWQMIRTTDTGGVKLLYNGEAVEGKCTNDRTSHMGVYYYGGNHRSFNSQYLYGEGFTYDTENRTFKLTGETKTVTLTESTFNEVSSMYTCATTEDECQNYIYKIISYYGNGEVNYEMYNISNINYSFVANGGFNGSFNSLAFAGYGLNRVEQSDSTTYAMSYDTFFEKLTMSVGTEYYYSDSVRYENNRYILYNSDGSDVQKIAWDSDSTVNNQLKNKYTCKNATTGYDQAYFVSSISGNTLYLGKLVSGNTNKGNGAFQYASTYTDNGDGTVTLNSPGGLAPANYGSRSTRVNNKYYCETYFTTTCDITDLKYAYSASSTVFLYKVSRIHAKSAIWNGTKYELQNTKYLIEPSLETDDFNTYRFSCADNPYKDVCNELYYVYYMYGSEVSRIKVKNGETIEQLYNSLINSPSTRSSSIKNVIEAWYENNLTEYEDYIEDIIYCNDRSEGEDLSGWHQDGNIINKVLFKGNSDTPYLTCSREYDKFSTLNDDAKMKAPIGLLTKSEALLLNNNNVLKGSGTFWLMTPIKYTSGLSPDIYIVNSSGAISSERVSYSNGVRPSISLIPNIKYTKGDGSKDNPYVIDTSGN